MKLNGALFYTLMSKLGARPGVSTPRALALLTRLTILEVNRESIMDGTLTLSSKLSPFPFAAIAIASYTQKSALNFDESATGITLDFNGSKITSVDEIVHALAKAGDLSGDSAKVSQPMGLC